MAMRTDQQLRMLQRAHNKWQVEMIGHLVAQRWDQIVLPNALSGSSMSWTKQWLFSEILGMTPFVSEVEGLLLRLFSEDIQEKGWLYYLITMTPSASAVEYFLERDIGDLNRFYVSRTILEHVLFTMNYTTEERLRLLRLLVVKGADVNIPHETSRETPLFRCVDYVCDVWHSAFEIRGAAERERDEARKQEYAVIAEVLLEYGAEPLLENEHGVSAIYWLESEGRDAVAERLLAKMMMFA